MSMAAKKTLLIVQYDLSSYACCYRHSHFKMGIQLFWNIEYESVFWYLFIEYIYFRYVQNF